MGVNVAQVAAGTQYTCARMSNGRATCWGLGTAGQLGNGVAGNSPVPVDVLGLGSGVTMIDASTYHTCAVTVAGSARCWGQDDRGQVGDGANIDDKLAPIDVVGSGIAAVAVGGNHTCARTTSGGVLCWGANGDGQLGNATRLDASVPTAVLVARTCFTLALAFTGSGEAPVASPEQSLGCPPAHYLPGAPVYLTARPGAGQRVQAWSSPVAGAPGERPAVLLMPTADTTATANYVPCRLLTRSHTGTGTTPAASPPFSTGCAADRYAAGETIFLQVVPGADQRVQQWTGAAATPAVGSQVNTLAMPNADRAVSVAYEPCFALNVSVVGQGQAANLNPPASVGCVEASRYAAGESVSLSASPAPGWSFAGWSGACGGSGVCQVTVQGATSVTATFVAGGTTWLPLVGAP
jgi:hypothetical protein